MKKKKLLFLFIGLIFISCCSIDPKNFETKECYVFAVCLHENEKNHDKSICVAHSDECIDSEREIRKREQLKYCNENLIPGMSENECRMYLNLK